MGHNLNHFKSGTAEILILSLAEFFLDKSEITMIFAMHHFLWDHLSCGEDIKKLNNCLLSFNSKASSALYYERDNDFLRQDMMKNYWLINDFWYKASKSKLLSLSWLHWSFGVRPVR